MEPSIFTGALAYFQLRSPSYLTITLCSVGLHIHADSCHLYNLIMLQTADSVAISISSSGNKPAEKCKANPRYWKGGASDGSFRGGSAYCRGWRTYGGSSCDRSWRSWGRRLRARRRIKRGGPGKSRLSGAAELWASGTMREEKKNEWRQSWPR